MILATETHSFHSIVNAARKREAGAIIKGSLKLKSIKAKQSTILKATDVGRFDHLTYTIFPSETKKDKGRKFSKKQKKNKF